MFNSNLQDKQLQCVDCYEKFIFSVEDQQFFSQKGYTEPKRCPRCRKARKQHDSGRSNDRSRSYNKPQYRVICDECGCETTVPFEPKTDRPVYCSDCYTKSF